MSNINAKIGKFALDSLTVGMYENEMVLYREYIQNSTDAIDKAINNLKWLESKGDSRIDIVVDDKNQRIKILDNGSGIEKYKVVSTLCDIGNSKKDFSKNRGFRGIGRLAGTAYCETLTFKTSYKGENVRSILKWDCIHLKELVKPGQYEGLSLEDVIKQCVSIEYEEEVYDEHYFEVILDGVDKSSRLLDIEYVRFYLSQVAPIEMNSVKFYYYSDLQVGIKKFMKENHIPIEEYPIEFNKKKLSKLYSTTKLKIHKKNEPDEIIGVKKEIIRDESGKSIAFLWYGQRKQFRGQIADDKIAGFRYRKSNIMVGDQDTLSKLFPQERYNKYYIGEVYVLDENIIPNARRDDFEENQKYKYLKEQLKIYFKTISDLISPVSELRNAEEKVIADTNKIKKLENELKIKLPKEEKQILKNEIHKINIQIENNQKKIKRHETRLINIGGTKYIKEYNIELEEANKKEKESEKTPTKNKVKEIDPLKGKSKEVKRTVRNILKLLKQNLDEKTYEELRDKIYTSV